MSILTKLAATAAVGAAAVMVAGSLQPASTAPRPATRAAAIDPADFTSPVDNPWFPLQPGLLTRYRGSEDKQHFKERVLVTHRTRTIEGVQARVVSDILRRADGSLAEKTTDYYADDNSGNAWYFGENTATYDRHGHVQSRDGTWRAGVDGARAGLIMPADPKATDAYRQEFLRGQAEDQAWIVGFKPSLRTPLRHFHHVLRTFEWSRLEPGVVSTKLYARGVGIAAEKDVAGGTERFAVVAVHH
jgi:hypothetical protein